MRGIRYGTKRKFNGKIYEAWDFAKSKDSAQRVARDVRKKEKVRARVTEEMPPRVIQHGWVVWVRPWPK